MPFRTRLSLATLALVATASLAGAQDTAVDGTPPVGAAPSGAATAVAVNPSATTSATAAGPLASTARVGVQARTAAAASLEVAELQPANLRKRGMPQMIIGGAALIGGLIIGDDVGTVVALGGLGFGLYGLYLYLQ